ncbi:MAG: nitroreductase family deazaflavin-dependent oxidoreductase [Chloroflexi bacterium]|nr:nitroreductase family deazaflavin-dependent oxidoreductase [Chloroflexota bacterium]
MALAGDLEAVLREARELDLTTTGRVTGGPHTVELWFAYQDGHVYFLSGVSSQGRPTDWYRNLRARPSASLRVKDRDIAVEATPFDAPEAADAFVMGLFRRKYGARTVNTWYRGSPHFPVRLRVVG